MFPAFSDSRECKLMKVSLQNKPWSSFLALRPASDVPVTLFFFYLFIHSFFIQKLFDAHEEQDVDAYANAVSFCSRIENSAALWCLNVYSRSMLLTSWDKSQTHGCLDVTMTWCRSFVFWFLGEGVWLDHTAGSVADHHAAENQEGHPAGRQRSPLTLWSLRLVTFYAYHLIQFTFPGSFLRLVFLHFWSDNGHNASLPHYPSRWRAVLDPASNSTEWHLLQFAAEPCIVLKIHESLSDSIEQLHKNVPKTNRKEHVNEDV